MGKRRGRHCGTYYRHRVLIKLRSGERVLGRFLSNRSGTLTIEDATTGLKRTFSNRDVVTFSPATVAAFSGL